MSIIRGNWKTYCAAGWCLLVCGLLCAGVALAVPGIADVVAGWSLLFSAFAIFIGVTAVRGSRHTAPLALTAILYLAFGALAAWSPWEGAGVLGTLISVFLSLDGLARLGTAFRLKPERGWLVALTGGFLSLALALLVFLGHSLSGVELAGLALGINTMAAGAMFLQLSFVLKSIPPESEDNVLKFLETESRRIALLSETARQAQQEREAGK
ncbi:MAG: hypothetical protein WCS77_05255 [Elusimicrobiaceae bacterium]